MSQPAAYHLSLYQGDTVSLSVTLTYKSSGGPIDLTGYAATAEIRATAAAAVPLAAFACTVDGPAGTIHLELAAADAAALPAGRAVWDCQTVDPAGGVRTWLAGNVLVTAEVTRP